MKEKEKEKRWKEYRVQRMGWIAGRGVSHRDGGGRVREGIQCRSDGVQLEEERKEG